MHWYAKLVEFIRVNILTLFRSVYARAVTHLTKQILNCFIQFIQSDFGELSRRRQKRYPLIDININVRLPKPKSIACKEFHSNGQELQLTPGYCLNSPDSVIYGKSNDYKKATIVKHTKVCLIECWTGRHLADLICSLTSCRALAGNLLHNKPTQVDS